MNLDISALGYRWRGLYSPYLSYRDGDVVFKEGGAWVMRHGQPQPFALGQQDATLKGHLLTGGVSVGEADYLDVIGEVGNIFCGALNRDLSHHFPYLGMSTPNVLERECIDYLDELDASYIRHFRVVVNDGVTFHASLCVCDFADIDFQVDTSAVEESHGELELF